MSFAPFKCKDCLSADNQDSNCIISLSDNHSSLVLPEEIRRFPSNMAISFQVYALTKERDMLRREQSRKNDSSILLKEKDEIIKQVMAEGKHDVFFHEHLGQ